MLVFLDFEASSLGSRSWPIEVAWVFEDGRSESHLIAPLPEWTDWDPRAEAVHGIPHALLLSDGEDALAVAQRMMTELAGHRLFVSAPSWDGQWLSRLLRAAGLERHALRLEDSELARREAATAVLGDRLPAEGLAAAAAAVSAAAETRVRAEGVRHRAQPDAEGEWQSWRLAAELARDWQG